MKFSSRFFLVGPESVSTSIWKVLRRVERKENNSVSWANLKEVGKLVAKSGNGEQMLGMVPGLGSVIGCPRPTPWQRRCGAYGHKCVS